MVLRGEAAGSAAQSGEMDRMWQSWWVRHYGGTVSGVLATGCSRFLRIRAGSEDQIVI